MLGPDDSVECAPFAAKIPAHSCVARHLAREPSGSGAGSVLPGLEACARCAIGAARADELARAGYWPRAYRVNPWRLKAQRTARERLRRSGALAPIPTCDGLPIEP